MTRTKYVDHMQNCARRHVQTVSYSLYLHAYTRFKLKVDTLCTLVGFPTSRVAHAQRSFEML
jgi:hypothetical protein